MTVDCCPHGGLGAIIAALMGATDDSRPHRLPPHAAARVAYAAAVLAIALLGLHLRLSWVITWTQTVVGQRGGWPSHVTFDPPNAGLAWEHDEYLYFVSTAVNAFKGRGFVPGYNDVQKAFQDAFLNQVQKKTFDAGPVVDATSAAITKALSQ